MGRGNVVPRETLGSSRKAIQSQSPWKPITPMRLIQGTLAFPRTRFRPESAILAVSPERGSRERNLWSAAA